MYIALTPSNEKVKESIIKYLIHKVTRRTRSLFLQLMADHEKRNGESAAAVNHEHSQQYVPVLRAERKVLQGRVSRLDVVSIRRLAYRDVMQHACESVTHVSGNALIGIVMTTSANHTRREPPHCLTSDHTR